MVAASELPIDTGASALKMAQTIFGDGVQVLSASYSGSGYSSGIYTMGDTISPGVTPSDTGVILSTGRARDFTNSKGQANQATNTSTNTRGENNNPMFNAIAGTNTYDASYLTVDFVPDGDVMTMQFVFSSEEFPEFATSTYQDAVGVWINGTHVPFAGQTVTPGTVSGPTNQNLYVDNTGSAYNTEMDGFTLTLTLTIPVIPGQTNTIMIGVADTGDSYYDSNLLIAGGSLQTHLVAADDAFHLQGNQTKDFNILGNDTPANGTITVTHINGVPVSVGDTVTLSTGQTVTLNADGTVTVVGDGTNEDFNFTYTVSDGTLQDTGIVTITSVPCFVAGTLIETAEGPRPVEALAPGTLVKTRDHGLQALRWIGRRVVPAMGELAPVRIRAGAFGTHGEVLVSPQHRVLIRDALAELLFEEAEVLVAAKHLVDGRRAEVVEGGEVEYVHILFDRHEVVTTGGLETESFLPGPQTTAALERDLVREICTLFPELDPATGQGYSPAARRVLKAFEARLLVEQGRQRQAA